MKRKLLLEWRLSEGSGWSFDRSVFGVRETNARGGKRGDRIRCMMSTYGWKKQVEGANRGKSRVLGIAITSLHLQHASAIAVRNLEPVNFFGNDHDANDVRLGTVFFC